MFRLPLRFPQAAKKNPRAHRPPGPRGRHARPAVEALENRCVLGLINALGSPIPFAAGTNPQSPVVADFNGDGKQDLAVVNHNPSGTVSVLLNGGNEGFAPRASYAVGPNPVALAAGDFHSDGRPDLVVVNGDGSLMLLPNRGDGTFAPALPITTLNPAARSLAVADFNGDGKADLALTRQDTVSVLTGNGDGTFAPLADYAVPDASRLAVGDFHGDGRPDLAVTTPGAPVDGHLVATGVAVLLNRGDGTFAPASHLAPGFQPLALAVGDFNGDGKQDIAAAATYGVTLLGNGDGTFAPPITLYTRPLDNGSISLAVGDFTSSGRQDLAVATSSGPAGRLSVLQNQGNGTFDTPDLLFYLPGEATPGSYDAAVLDINGDGRPDLVVCAAPTLFGVPFSPNTVMVLLNVSKAAPSPPGFGAFDPGTATWYLHNANAFSAPQASPFRYGAPGWEPVAGDWTGPGHAGIGVSDPSTGTWYLRHEDSPGPPGAGVFRYGLPEWVPITGD
jgi:hypothetical protein